MKNCSLLFILILGGLFFGCSSSRVTKENRADKNVNQVVMEFINPGFKGSQQVIFSNTK